MKDTMQVQWGWRIQCSESDCEHTLERWSGEGTPSLWHGDDEGWFLHRYKLPPGRRNSRLGPYRRVGFCPEHAGPALDWLATLRAWNRARWEKGKEVHTLLSCAKRLIGSKVRSWADDNPKPMPPWELP